MCELRSWSVVLRVDLVGLGLEACCFLLQPAGLLGVLGGLCRRSLLAQLRHPLARLALALSLELLLAPAGLDRLLSLLGIRLDLKLGALFLDLGLTPGALLLG